MIKNIKHQSRCEYDHKRSEPDVELISITIEFFPQYYFSKIMETNIYFMFAWF